MKPAVKRLDLEAMKLPLLACVLFVCFLALGVSKAVPLMEEEDQEKATNNIVEVNKGCQIPGFQPVQGSICLRLQLLAGLNFNIGVGAGQNDKDKKKTVDKDQSQPSKEQESDKKKKKKGQKRKRNQEVEQNADDEE